METNISTSNVPLSDSLKTLIEATDFKIFGSLPVDDVLEEIKATGFFITTFGGGFPKRPTNAEPPEDVLPHESTYTRKLFGVYEQRLSKTVAQLSDLPVDTLERRHFNQMRRQFYSAEALNEFVRELTEQGTFANFQTDIFNAVWTVLSDDHDTPFQRLQKSLSSAANVPQGANAIYLVAEALDKQGVCHQLANADKIDWNNP